MYANAFRFFQFLSGDWSSSFVSFLNERAKDRHHFDRHQHHHERTTMVTVITG
jgi:hypothetical protein